MSGDPGSHDAFLWIGQWAFDGIAVWAPSPWRIVYANEAFQQLTGALMEPPSAEATSSGRGDLALSMRLTKLLDRFAGVSTSERFLSAPLALGDERGTVDVRLVRLGNDVSSQIGMIIRSSDEVDAADIGVPTRRDPLTGLLDREFLMRRLADLLHGDRSGDRNFALLFLDLDNFKHVNDKFGHLIGDEVLREAARRIADCVREGDHVVRFGGDEFIVILAGIAEASETEPVTGRIHAAVGKPIALPVGEVTLTLSVGMVLASDEYRSPEDLVNAADRAMYAAKRLSQGLSHTGQALQ
jgi:diguanylate cyclase (GGDEF)-like protein